MTTDSSIESPDLRDAEPSVGGGALPAWMIILCGLLFYTSTMFLDHNGGEFNKFVYITGEKLSNVTDRQPKGGDDDVLAKGKKFYDLYCIACHQSSGMGTPGQFPPLASSEWVLAEGPNRIIRVVLNGLIGPIQVKGQAFNNNMLAWRDIMTKDEEVSAVLSYIRKNKAWGNNASMVTPDQVKRIREATTTRGTRYWTAEELLAMPEKD